MIEFIQNNSSFLVVGVILAGIFFSMGWFIKRHFIDGRWPGPTSRFINRQVHSTFQNDSKQEAADQVWFIEEEDRED